MSLSPALVTLAVSYLCGSIPFGLVLSKWAGLGDIRAAGSGNIGATNVLRLGGKKLGAATLALDALKGALPVAAAQHFAADLGILAAAAAFLGHLFPVWLRFRGGKGVATALGIFLALSPVAGAAVCAVWLTVARLSGYSSLSSLTATGAAPLALALAGAGTSAVAAAGFISLLVWLRHADNIRRLAAGTESKIRLHPPPDSR